MVISGLSMDQTALRVELKCAIMQYGVQFVMTSGTFLMQMWSADSLDSPQQVWIQRLYISLEKYPVKTTLSGYPSFSLQLN